MAKQLFDLELDGGKGKGLSLNPLDSAILDECSFFDEQNEQGRVKGIHGKRYVGKSIGHLTGVVTMGVITFVMVAVLGRLIFLQVVGGEEYVARAEGNRQRLTPIPSERGLIFDRDGAQLTKNIPNFSLTIVPQDLPRDAEERDSVVDRLAVLTGQEKETLQSALEEFGSYSYESIVIEEDIPYDAALSIQIGASDLPGISIQRGSKRLYEFQTSTLPTSLSHVLGYVGKLNREELEEQYDRGYLPSDQIGKTGIEKTYEEYMRGVYGFQKREVNAYGREQTVLIEKAPVAGAHIRLHIDLDAQEKLEEILSSHLKTRNLKRGSAVAVDPRDGSILALVSLPAFDNNDFSGGISADAYHAYITDEDNPLFNRAIGGTYPSGSTIKPAMAAAALEEGIITPQTTFLSTGGIQVGPWFFPDWLPGGHGNTNVRASIANSVNTFYYYIGGGHNTFVGLGIDRIGTYLDMFGFAKKTGIDLPAEASGFIPSREWKERVKEERWYVGDTYNTSIGQGDFLATPLQIAMMTGAVANGGTLYTPKVVESVIDPTTQEERPFEPVAARTGVIEPEHLHTVRLGMHDCVSYGSCRRLASLPFSSAGKTGTAQWSNNKEPHAWFTSFAPFENPEIVVTVLVEEGGEGGVVSTPIATEFYAWWWQHGRGE